MESLINIYKTSCELCKKNTFALDYISICLQCGQIPLENQAILIENPIDLFIKPKSLIIAGSFRVLDAETYKNSEILHIGITNSKSLIYNFWGKYRKETGKENNFWEKVLNFPLNSELENAEFDKLLEENLTDQMKTYPVYDQMNNNCYSFVCRFLNSINYGFSQWTKESLALNLIEPKIEYLEKYANVIQKLGSEKNGVFMENIEKKKIVYYVCDKCGKSLHEKRKRCVVCEDFDLCLECFEKFKHEHKMMII